MKSVLDDAARGVFQGRIEVDQIAQKTDGYQMNQALLLSPKAEMDIKPELQIFADDVKCSHGATIGALDPEQIFYLRSRGIAETEARSILIRAFLTEALEPVTHEVARGDVRGRHRKLVDRMSVALKSMPFEIAKIRKDFPILDSQVHGKKLVFLDFAASAQKPRAVIDAMVHVMEAQYANVHRGLHYMSEKTSDAYEAVRDKVAGLLNAASREEIVFTRNATEAINLVAYS